MRFAPTPVTPPVDPAANVAGLRTLGLAPLTSKGTSFTVDATVAGYLLTASTLTITLDDALPVGSRWELLHADPTVPGPAHAFASTSGTSAIDIDDGLASATTKTWQGGRRSYVVHKTAAGVWRIY